MILPESPNVQKLVDLIEGREIGRVDQLQLIQGLAEAFRSLGADDRRDLLKTIRDAIVRDERKRLSMVEVDGRLVSFGKLTADGRDPNRLNELWDALRSLQQLTLFHDAYLERGKTGERAAYIEALWAVLIPMEAVAEKYGCAHSFDDCFAWFRDLRTMLEDLNDGLVSPVFDCPRQSNALSTNIWSERAVAVLVVEALCLLGARPRAAAKRVISNMSLDVSEADVLSWRSEFKKDKVKNREARALYQMEMEAAQGMDRSKLENDMKRMFDDGIREYWGIVPPASPAAGE